MLLWSDNDIEQEYQSLQKLKEAELPIIDAVPIEKMKNPLSGEESMGLLMPRIHGLFSSAAEISDKSLKSLDPEARARALSDLKKILPYLAKNEIKDFQVLLDTNTGHVYIHDPQELVMGKPYADFVKQVSNWIRHLKEQ